MFFRIFKIRRSADILPMTLYTNTHWLHRKKSCHKHDAPQKEMLHCVILRWCSDVACGNEQNKNMFIAYL